MTAWIARRRHPNYKTCSTCVCDVLMDWKQKQAEEQLSCLREASAHGIPDESIITVEASASVVGRRAGDPAPSARRPAACMTPRPSSYEVRRGIRRGWDANVALPRRDHVPWHRRADDERVCCPGAVPMKIRGPAHQSTSRPFRSAVRLIVLRKLSSRRGSRRVSATS